MNTHPLRLYEFGPFRLNVTERFLESGDKVVPLTPKVFDTLRVLVENSGHVLSKDELMQALWPDSFVEESSLTQNISLLRRALAEFEGERQYIETMPKRGYRFVGEVRECNLSSREMVQTNPAVPQNLDEANQSYDDSQNPVVLAKTKPSALLQIGRYTRSRMYLTVVAGFAIIVCTSVFAYRWQKNRTTLGTSRPQSIAVLPFQTIGPQTESELMGLGVANALIIRLSALDQTKVLPTSSVSRYVGRKQDASSIGKELGVDAVLDGTVQRDGDQVRVTAQLIRSSDGRTIWTGTYDRNYRSIFDLQDAISEELGSALEPNMRKDTRDRLAIRLTESQEAYEAYVTGFYFWNKRTKENLLKAIKYFELAVQKDPNFALAHAMLADSYYLGFQKEYQIYPEAESLRLAKLASQKALSLDDKIPEAHVIKARLMVTESNLAAADREFQRALELDGNSAVGHLRYGCFLFYSYHRLSDALLQVKRARELDPTSALANAEYAYMLYMSRDYDAAIKFYKRALELQPDVPNARMNLAEAYVRKQMFEEALAEFEKLRESSPFSSARGKAHAYAAAGRRAEALRIFSELLQSRGRERLSPYDCAVIYVALGDKDAAFRWLEKVIGKSISAKLKFDPEMDSLRDDPRFREYLARHAGYADKIG